MSQVAPEPQQEPQAPPAAEPTTTDSEPGTAGPPESIPYTRFKEVNDQLRPFKDLEEYGYDADSLRQLAEWDANFSSDPAKNWMEIASQIDALPEGVKQAVEQALANGGEPTAPATPSAESSETDDKPPAWAQSLLEENEARKKREQEEQEEAERAAFDDMLNGLLSDWTKLDVADGIVDPEDNTKSLVPQETMLNHIVAAAGRGGHTSPEDILKAARGDVLKMRETFLKPITKRDGTPPPKPVPGSGDTPPNSPEPPKTLSEATERAKEFMSRQT